MGFKIRSKEINKRSKHAIKLRPAFQRPQAKRRIDQGQIHWVGRYQSVSANQRLQDWRPRCQPHPTHEPNNWFRQPVRNVGEWIFKFKKTCSDNDSSTRRSSQRRLVRNHERPEQLGQHWWESTICLLNPEQKHLVQRLTSSNTKSWKMAVPKSRIAIFQKELSSFSKYQ